MRIGKSAGGSAFSQTLYFKPGEIDRMCEDELRKANMLPDKPEPIDIELFTESHLECTVDYADIPQGVMGYTYFATTGKPTVVGISPDLDDGTATGTHRVRSTFAHEAGHCILHPILFMEDPTPKLLNHNLDFEKRRILCRPSDFNQTKQMYDGRWWEYQANCAIGGFLLPKKLVIIALAPFLTKSGGLGLEVLESMNRILAEREVSRIFSVSQAAARIRIEQIFPSDQEKTLL
jgi:hypothetical protein